MDYVCLAAGKGTRFGRLGSYLQKCMYPVGLRPFVEYSLCNLRRSIALDPARDRLVLVVGHFAEQVRGYFGESYEGLRIRYLEQPDPLGTGHALSLVHKAFHPDAPVVVWLADLYVPTALFERIGAHPAENVVTLAAGESEESEKLRATVVGDRVTKAWCGEGALCDIGLWKFSPDTLATMTSVKEKEYRVLPNLQHAIDRGTRVGYLEADAWLHLGGTKPTPEANTRRVVRRVLELEHP